MKRTNIVLDEKLVEESKKLTGIKTVKEVVDYALREVVRRKKQLGLLKLKGKVKWVGKLDEMRATR